MAEYAACATCAWACLLLEQALVRPILEMAGDPKVGAVEDGMTLLPGRHIPEHSVLALVVVLCLERQPIPTKCNP